MGQIISDWNNLAMTLNTRRQRGEKIITTNGIFDVLHVGHVRYLQAARALGDVLVVGINTDAGTRRLKGLERPYVNQDERAELVAALGCVDFVTLFDEPTPVALLQAIHPDIHTKGGDYDPMNMPETAVVEQGGGRIVTLPFVIGRSTTDLVERIRNSQIRSGTE